MLQAVAWQVQLQNNAVVNQPIDCRRSGHANMAGPDMLIGEVAQVDVHVAGTKIGHVVAVGLGVEFHRALTVDHPHQPTQVIHVDQARILEHGVEGDATELLASVPEVEQWNQVLDG